MQKENYFCEILNMCFEENPDGIRKNSELIEKIGSEKISMRNLQRYRKGTAVPRYETAMLILQTLGYNILPDELTDCLMMSRFYEKQLRIETQEKSLVRKARSKLGITVSGCKVTCVDVPELMDKLEQRIIELYGDSADVNMYVANLIEKDLIESSEKGGR